MTGNVERECGACSLCCKVLMIEEIEKPADKWCQHCKPGKGGCMIYETRPGVCSIFQCEWLRDDLPNEWRPLDSKMVVHVTKGNEKFNFLNIVVDIGVPNRWREPFWFSRIKKMAEVAHSHNVIVRVQVGRRGWFILPFQEPVEIPIDTAKIDISENRFGVRKIKFKSIEDADTPAG